MILKILNYIREVKWLFLLQHSHVRVNRNATLSKGKNVRIISSNIFLSSKAKLMIKDNVRISNVSIYISDGDFTIGKDSIVEGLGYNKSVYIVNTGSIHIADHVKCNVKRIWVRFMGNLNIGSYTNINDGSEIRVDESVTIGNYNQISYEVNIWDTNTHNIYSPEKRAEITRKYYPYYGFEYEKPKTAPIHIGDNCWIGERSSILKGTFIGDNVIVGYNTLLSNVRIDKNKKVVQKNEIRIL